MKKLLATIGIIATVFFTASVYAMQSIKCVQRQVPERTMQWSADAAVLHKTVASEDSIEVLRETDLNRRLMNLGQRGLDLAAACEECGAHRESRKILELARKTIQGAKRLEGSNEAESSQLLSEFVVLLLQEIAYLSKTLGLEAD